MRGKREARNDEPTPKVRAPVSPNAAGVSGLDEPFPLKDSRSFRLSMESIQRPSPQSINRPHPSPHLCRMIGVRVHTSCCDSVTGHAMCPRVTVLFLLFLGTFPIRYVSYSISMYLECILMCILMCPVHIHQDTSRYIKIHLYLSLWLSWKCILPWDIMWDMYPSLQYI